MGMRGRDTGIEDVPVKKVELLERLEKNKTKHEGEWKDAFSGYQEKWIEEAKKRQTRIAQAIEASEKAKSAEGFVRFPTEVFRGPTAKPPECHTRDYVMAIDVFTAYQTIGDDGVDNGIIVLSINDFNNFWRDDWDWKRAHRDAVLNFSNGPTEGWAGGPESIVGGLNELKY